MQLEKEHISINDCFVHLESYINILLNIYSRFTSLGGYDYCLKLKSLVQKYQQIENSEIQLLRSITFTQNTVIAGGAYRNIPFTYAKKRPIQGLSPTKNHEEIDVANFAYKWLTFKRNNICFIVFLIVTVLWISHSSMILSAFTKFLFGTIDNSTITIRDPLRLDEQPSRSIVLVTYARDTFGYFYDTIGKSWVHKKILLHEC